MGKKVKRLYEQFKPEEYNLTLDVDRESMSFSGIVVIKGNKVGRPSQRLTFHQKDLKITSVKINKTYKGEVSEIKIDRMNTHKSYDEVRLHSNEMIYPGQYEVIIEFSGNITTSMHGMYPCFFEDKGVQKSLIATQFESHHAREVLPCIDEPEAKATFDLTLKTPKNEIVLSNTPIKSQQTISERLITKFEPTPIMSTYLLAFVFGEMHSVEAKTKNGVSVRSWATSVQQTSYLQHANDEAVKILEFFEEYFHTPFPLDKLDQVALPDFEAGAMENWGLITYREVALLTDPNNRSISSEQYVSMVVGHEVSHQWFGNLVTMKWWDDLWLNESFASLMEHIALDSLHPDWNQWEQYTVADVISCSNRDIYKDVQSVKIDVLHPDEIHALFDPAIVYAKGGRLLKMLIEYIGEQDFRKGLKSYFKNFAYKNTTRDDLWKELSNASGKDVAGLMNPWLEQSGMPQVDVALCGKSLRLSQKRFILDKEDDEQIWPIPLFASQPLSRDILTKKTDTINTTHNNPVMLNVSGSTHAVVRYADIPTKKYVEQSIINLSIPAESRINVLNDYILLARKGENSIVDILKIIESCGEEPRDAVWQQIGRVVGTLSSLTEGDEEVAVLLKQLRVKLSSNWYSKLGWNDKKDDDPNTKGLRQTILSYTVHGEHEQALTEAKKRYYAVSKVDDLPAEQTALIIGAVVRSGDDVIEDLINQYKTTVSSDLQHSICAGLCSTKDPKVAKYIIEQAIGQNGFVRPQDIFRWHAYLMRNHYTRNEAWDWITNSWPRLEKLFGDSKSFDHFIVYSASSLNTEQWQNKYEEFFRPKMVNLTLKRNITIALAEIPARVAWRNREESKIKTYLTK